MNSKERVLNTFIGKKTDKLPLYHVGFSNYAAKYILNKDKVYVGGGIQQWREANALMNGENAHKEFIEKSLQDAMELSKILNMDIIRTQYWRLNEKPFKKIDDYTFIYGNENKWEKRVFIPDVEVFDVVESNFKRTVDQYEEIEKIADDIYNSAVKTEYNSEDFKYINIANQYFNNEKILIINGMDIGLPSYDGIWLEAMLIRPELVKKVIDAQVIKAQKLINAIKNLDNIIIFGGNDFGSNTGTFFSPNCYKDFYLPGLKKVTDLCHSNDLRYCFASDGNLWGVADYHYSESGIDACFETESAGMDMKKLRNRFNDLTIIGNMRSQVLHTGTEEDVKNDVLECINDAKQIGKAIIGLSNYIVPGTPYENIDMLIKTINDNIYF